MLWTRWLIYDYQCASPYPGTPGLPSTTNTFMPTNCTPGMMLPVINLACPYGSTIKNVVSMAWGDESTSECQLPYGQAAYVVSLLEAACVGRRYCSVPFASGTGVTAPCATTLFSNATWTCSEL